MMKRSLVLVAAICLFCISCSTDSDKSLDADGGLIGFWKATGVRAEQSSNVNLPKEIADKLLKEGCELLSYNFMKDDVVVIKSKLNYIEVNATPTGLDVTCPERTDVKTTTWRLSGDKLTYVDEDKQEKTITLIFENNTFIIAGEEIDPDNYTGIQIVFTKQ